ncbi:MAG: hypothetical protein Q4C75_05895 [Bergeyella zoohelcum]|nr:hypothetical protein [Bergeyella zoohelcum]
MFENLGKNLDLKTELAEYGYDETKISEGKTLFTTAQNAYNNNLTQTREEVSATKTYQQKYEQTLEAYITHRKKARIVFDEDPQALQTLKLKGKASKIIATSIQEMKEFYSVLNTTETLKTAVATLKITAENITQQLANLTQVEKDYATYLAEKGESQQATKDKNKAFAELEKWVNKFYRVAKIALEDRPQLLESLGKFIKS